MTSYSTCCATHACAQVLSPSGSSCATIAAGSHPPSNNGRMYPATQQTPINTTGNCPRRDDQWRRLVSTRQKVGRSMLCCSVADPEQCSTRGRCTCTVFGGLRHVSKGFECSMLASQSCQGALQLRNARLAPVVGCKRCLAVAVSPAAAYQL